MLGDRGTQIVLMIVLGAALLWWLMGSETCEGCIYECRAVHGDKADCVGKCAAKGLDCPMDLEQPTMDVKSVCEECLERCSKSGTASGAQCVEECVRAGKCQKPLGQAPPQQQQQQQQPPSPASAASKKNAPAGSYGGAGNGLFAAGSAYAPATGVVYGG